MSKKQITAYSKKENNKAVTFIQDFIIERIKYIESIDNPSEEELNSLQVYNEYLENYSSLVKENLKQ